MTRPAAAWRGLLKPAVIVAESLRRGPDPPFATAPPLAVSAREVASAIARTLAPRLAFDEPPQWLLPDQRVSFARGLAAIRRFGIALLAEPVGSGKTWIALALAKVTAGRAAAIVPAALREQWQRAAIPTAVGLEIQTHEQWSRAPRELADGLVVIDEAHRFRHANIRRYVHLAPALRGREGVLLTATPVVNRLEDVANQLLLLARDDALAASGIASIREVLLRERAPSQLAELVVAGSGASGRPTATSRLLPATPEEEARARDFCRRLDQLVLCRQQAIRGLLAGVLATAFASSPAALRAALLRYRALLLQSADAGREGIRLGRRGLARLLGADQEQTVLWGLLEVPAGPTDLVASDLPEVDDCLAWLKDLSAQNDPKTERLIQVLSDNARSIVFAVAKATVGHLRRVLKPTSRIAWCTGTEAGIGTARLQRSEVLDWFGPRAQEHELAPRILVTTDVAAEGLDLQRAARVVHYDLPWTAVRLDQRAGRVVRLGSRHSHAELVTLAPPAALEARLGIVEQLTRKGPLPSRLGLGSTPDRAWSRRVDLAERWSRVKSVRGSVVLESDRDAAVVGIELCGGEQALSGFVLARCSRGAWCSDLDLIDELLQRAASGGRQRPDPQIAAAIAASLQREIRVALLGAGGSLWRIRPVGGEARPALARLRLVAAEAVRRRDRTTLAFADRAIAFLRRGHTAGERDLALQLAAASDDVLPDLLARLPPPDPLPPPIRAQITGLIVFQRKVPRVPRVPGVPTEPNQSPRRGEIKR